MKVKVAKWGIASRCGCRKRWLTTLGFFLVKDLELEERAGV